MSKDHKTRIGRERRQERICRGAMKLFRKKCFHNTTMREIAGSSGVGLGNLYNHIHSKEDILLPVWDNILDQPGQGLGDDGRVHNDALENLVAVIRSIFKGSFTARTRT